MRILHVIANLAPRYGGPSKACIEMAQAVAKQGHEVTIVTTNQDGDAVLPVPIDQPVKQDRMTIYYFTIQCPRCFGVSWPLARFLKNELKTFDVVHIHSLYLFHNVVAEYYCNRYHIPYVIRPHGTLDPYIYRRHRLRKMIMELLFQNHYLKRASGIHFTTTEEAQLAAPYIFQRPVFVIPNGLHVEDYKNLPPVGTFRKQYPKISTKKIVLFLGRINFKKGLDLLIPAFAQLTQDIPDIHLVLAGPDNDGYLKQVNSWAEQYHIQQQFTYVGMLLGEAKLAAFRDADLFALPSYSENFGLSVLEAMACGVPIVISDHVNLWHTIHAHQAGLVSNCEVGDLYIQMRKILSNTVLANEMKNRAKLLVQEQYDWECVAKQLIHMYQMVRE